MRFIVVRNAHTGIQMDLGESGQNELAHQLPCVLHRLRLRKRRPRQRPQMVAAKDDLRGVDAGPDDQRLHIGIKIARLHAGVAAELIDLIGRRLDQDGRIALLAALQSRQQDKFIGAAAGVNTGRPALLLCLYDLLYRMHTVLPLLFCNIVHEQHLALDQSGR